MNVSCVMCINIDGKLHRELDFQLKSLRNHNPRKSDFNCTLLVDPLQLDVCCAYVCQGGNGGNE